MQPSEESGSLIRVGLIGPGKHAQEHLLPALRMLPRSRLVCISSRSEAWARAVALQWGAAGWTTDWRSMVDPEFCDAVVVSATPDLHAQVMEYALCCGVAVFVEKPPAPDTPTLRSLIVNASHAKTPTFVGYNLLFSASLKRVAEVANEFGGPRLVRIRCLANKPREILWEQRSIEQSMLYAVGIHGISVALMIRPGLEYTNARISRINSDTCAVQISLQDLFGVVAEIEIGNYTNRFVFDVEIVTVEGTIVTLRELNEIEIAHGASSKSYNAFRIDRKELVKYELGALDNGLGKIGYFPALQAFINDVSSGGAGQVPISKSLDIFNIIDNSLSDVQLSP